MAATGYTLNDVAFLLSLTHDEAVEQTFPVGSSLRKLSDETEGHGFCAEDTDVPLIARWAEIERAKRSIVTNKENIALTQLRLQGYTDEEVAGMLGICDCADGKHHREACSGRRAVGRRWRATLAEILDLLGGESDTITMALDHIDMCLKCGRHPRGHLMRRTPVWINSRWRWKTVQRRSSICNPCLTELEV